MFNILKKLHQKLIAKLFPVNDEEWLLLIPESEIERVNWARERALKLYKQQEKLKGVK